MNDHKRTMLVRTQARLARVALVKEQRATGLQEVSATRISESAESSEGTLVNEWRIA